MLQQIPLEEAARTDLVPQAIIAQPISYFSSIPGIRISRAADDFDEFEGAVLRINGNLLFAIKHYAGHPDKTTTIYLPHSVSDVAQITAIIRRIADELKIMHAWILWQRADDPDL